MNKTKDVAAETTNWDVRKVRSERETRVLIVGMLDSIHLVNWIRHHTSSELRILLFPSSPMRRLHPELTEIIQSSQVARIRVVPGAKLFALPLWLADQIFADLFRASLLWTVIKLFKPQIVHANELQNAGYLTSRVFRVLRGEKPIFIATNYGSDIFWFGRKPRHAKRLRELLSQVDRYAAECARDVQIARNLGFKGLVLPVRPNAGGFSKCELTRTLAPAENRSLIMVKGYHGWVGRARIAIDALELIADDIRQFEILIYSSNIRTLTRASRLARRTGLNITALGKGALSHSEMLDRFSRAIVYVGLSLSDGISTSMLEAMAMGAIPVQTSTACCDEWFETTGVAISNISAQEVAEGIGRAIELALTTDSALKNREIIREKASREEIAEQATHFYQL